MNKQQKIQAALDALPNATGGEWCIGRGGDIFTAMIPGPMVAQNAMFPADRALISAAKELAEEVVRLQAFVQCPTFWELELRKVPENELLILTDEIGDIRLGRWVGYWAMEPGEPFEPIGWAPAPKWMA